MGKISKRSAAVITLIATLAGGKTYAAQCGEAFQQPDDSDYFDIQQTPLDDKTLNQVRSFTQLLDGRWQGTGLEVKCGVSDDQPLAIISNYDVDAEIMQHFLGSSIMEVEQETKRFVNLDRIVISPETEKYQQGQRTGHRNYSVELTESDTPTMVFDEKYRLFTPRLVRGEERNAVRLVHEIKTVSLNQAEDTLTVNRDVYVNGHFTAQQEWQLTRH